MTTIRQQQQPLATAMWDTGWLTRHYPLWHGFEWLTLMLESLSAPHPDDLKGLSEEERCRHVDSHFYNPRQFDFYNTFASATIRKLKSAWPARDFFFSFTHSNSTPWDRMDLGAFAAAELVTWMRGKLERVAAVGRQLGIPYGNTEGWGPIMWREHPLLDWSFVKETGLVGARLGAELGFAFNCSSNFTHPQFRGLWDDIDWHREVTGIIKHGAAT